MIVERAIFKAFDFYSSVALTIREDGNEDILINIAVANVWMKYVEE